MRLLLISDDQLSGEVLAEAFSLFGYTCRYCTMDVLECHTPLMEGQWDIVVMDETHPASMELSCLLKLRSRRPEMPLILLTSRGINSTHLKRLHSCFQAVFHKPVDIRLLALRMQELTRRKSA
jgi:DNA-binding response OmpR family regulator